MPRSARRHRNRALFRLVNDEIFELHHVRSDEGTHALICECRQLSCGDSCTPWQLRGCSGPEQERLVFR
jgi:hypothetical protein